MTFGSHWHIQFCFALFDFNLKAKGKNMTKIKLKVVVRGPHPLKKQNLRASRVKNVLWVVT